MYIALVGWAQQGASPFASEGVSPFASDSKILCADSSRGGFTRRVGFEALVRDSSCTYWPVALALSATLSRKGDGRRRVHQGGGNPGLGRREGAQSVCD